LSINVILSSLLSISIFTTLTTYAETEVKPFYSGTILLPGIEQALVLNHRNRSESGGFSAMWLSKDCKTTWFISDYSQVSEGDLKEQPVSKSKWFETKNILDQTGRIKSINVTYSGQLKALDGSVLGGAAESVVWHNNGLLLSLDDTGNLLKYSVNEKYQTQPSVTQIRNALMAKPTIAYKQPQLGQGNAGLESITITEDGSILSMWEKYKLSDKFVPVQIIDKQGYAISTNYRAVSSPKDITTLQSGEIIVLEKDWLGAKGSRLRLSLLDQKALKTSSELSSVTLFDRTELAYDNFEGIASCTANGKEWIYLVSDDNGDWHTKDVEEKGRERQKTLFIGFEVNKLLSHQ